MPIINWSFSTVNWAAKAVGLFLTGQPNAMGGREVGLQYGLLCHMGSETQTYHLVQDYWQSPRLDSVQARSKSTWICFDKIHDGQHQSVWSWPQSCWWASQIGDKIIAALKVWASSVQTALLITIPLSWLMYVYLRPAGGEKWHCN